MVPWSMSRCSSVDILLVVGNWRQIALLAEARPGEISWCHMPVEVDDASPAHSRAPQHELLSAPMVALMPMDEIPNPIAAIACLLMGKSLYQRRKRLQGDPLAEHHSDCRDDAVRPGALQKNRWVDLVVKGLMDVAGRGPI